MRPHDGSPSRKTFTSIPAKVDDEKVFTFGSGFIAHDGELFDGFGGRFCGGLFFSSKYRLFSRTINSLKFSRKANGIAFSVSSIKPFNKANCEASLPKSEICAVASIKAENSLAFWKANLA